MYYFLAIALLLSSCSLTCIESKSGGDTSVTVSETETATVDPAITGKP